MEIYASNITPDSLIRKCLDYMESGRREIALIKVSKSIWVIAASDPDVSDDHKTKVRLSDEQEVRAGVNKNVQVVITRTGRENNQWIYRVKYKTE